MAEDKDKIELRPGSKKSDKKSDKKASQKNNSKQPLDFKKFAPFIIGVIVVILIAGVGFSVYQYYQSTQATYEEMIEESDLLVFNGDPDGAIAFWENVIDTTDDPDEKADAYVQLARVYTNISDNQKALELLQIIPGLNSNMPKYTLYTSLFSVAYELGDYELAEPYLENVISSLNENDIDYELESADWQELLEEIREINANQ